LHNSFYTDAAPTGLYMPFMDSAKQMPPLQVLPYQGLRKIGFSAKVEAIFPKNAHFNHQLVPLNIVSEAS
jgi:hypothetical protein